jgi:hypothetical protein
LNLSEIENLLKTSPVLGQAEVSGEEAVAGRDVELESPYKARFDRPSKILLEVSMYSFRPKDVFLLLPKFHFAMGGMCQRIDA